MTIKSRNNIALLLVVLANSSIFFLLSAGLKLELSTWWKSVVDIQNALPLALAVALVGIINTQLSAKAKERIVFCEWDNPLPGCKAFTFYANRDPRIDITKLEEKFGPLPQDPIEQNRTWYKIYKEFREDPAVIDANKGYLFARDYAGMSATT